MVYVKQDWQNLPNETTPITAERLRHMETQYDEAVAESAAQVSALKSTPSFITYKSWSGVDYEVITVASSRGIKKIQVPEFQPGVGTTPRTSRRHPVTLARLSGAASTINCDAGINIDSTYAMIQGINITGGVAYQGFGAYQIPPDIKGADLEALALYRDGVIRPIYKSDQKTAQQYVDEGVTDTFGYGPILVRDGVSTGWWTDPRFETFYASVSARSIIGQKDDGSIVLITSHGRSGSTGISGEMISRLALREGCVVAINLDGGGTTQAIWQGQMVHSSADPLFYRTLLQGIAVLDPPGNVFDSGDVPFAPRTGITPYNSGRPVLSLRRVGNRVTATVNATGTFAVNSWVYLNELPIPEHFWPATIQEARGSIASASGNYMGASLGSDGIFAIRTNAAAQTVASGSISWIARDPQPTFIDPV